MPFVTVKTVKGVFNEIQKQEILEGITEVITRVAAVPEGDFQEAVWVVVEEQEPGNWYLGGKKPNPELMVHLRKHSDEGYNP